MRVNADPDERAHARHTVRDEIRMLSGLFSRNHVIARFTGRTSNSYRFSFIGRPDPVSLERALRYALRQFELHTLSRLVIDSKNKTITVVLA